METRDAREPRRVLVLSTTAFTLLFAVWLMLGVLGVPIRDELGLTPIELTWLTSIAVLSGSLVRLPFGMLTDRIGGRKVTTGLLVFTAVPCALFCTVTSFGEALAYAFLFGVAGNSFSAGIAWNAAWFPRERQGVALGTFGAGNVGASVTKIFGPALIAAVPASGFFGGLVPGGWRFVPAVYAVLLLVMAAFVWFGSPTPDRSPGSGRSLASMLVPLRAVRVWRFGLYYVVVFGAYVAFSLWLPAYYARVYGMPLGQAALLTALFIFPASLLRPLGGYLSDRYGARPVTYGVFAAMLVASALLCVPREVLDVGPWGFFALVEVLGIGMGVGKASVYKYIPEYFPADVGLVGGLVGTLGALGGFFLPLSFGYLEAAVERPEVCFWVLLGLVAWSFAWLHAVVLSLGAAGEPVAKPAAHATDAAACPEPTSSAARSG